MSNVIQKNNIVAKKQRQPWIDIAKGILILLVLLGHFNT